MYKKYEKEIVNDIISKIDDGAKKKTLSNIYNIPRGTICYWYKNKDEIKDEIKDFDLNEYLKNKKSEYSYILGVYLGDGTISKIKRGYKLRIFLDSKYYNIVEESVKNLKLLFPNNKVNVHKELCNMYIITLYSNLLPKLFPQFGKGLKHKRNIILDKFQLENIDNIQLIKGLFHSDGSLYKAKIRIYEKFFYNFTNMSKDIIDIYCKALNNIGIYYNLNQKKKNNVYQVNVYKKEYFTKLYFLIGAKNLDQINEIEEYIQKERKKKEKIINIIEFKTQIKMKNFCECGKEIDKRSNMCSTCDKVKQRKVKERPSVEQLLKELSNSNYTALGKKYGVSDNCIRKWIK